MMRPVPEDFNDRDAMLEEIKYLAPLALERLKDHHKRTVREHACWMALQRAERWPELALKLGDGEFDAEVAAALGTL
jgi:hypothetical protein